MGKCMEGCSGNGFLERRGTHSLTQAKDKCIDMIVDEHCLYTMVAQNYYNATAYFAGSDPN